MKYSLAAFIVLIFLGTTFFSIQSQLIKNYNPDTQVTSLTAHHQIGVVQKFYKDAKGNQ